MRWSQIENTPCPLAQTMAVIGDSWTVLIIRDAVRGARKFEEFIELTGASRAILAERLARLVEHRIFERVLYQAHPPRYEYSPTSRGRALQPVMMSMAHWAETHLPEAVVSVGRRHTTCGHRFTPVLTCSECGEKVTPDTVTYDLFEKQALLQNGRGAGHGRT